MHAFVQGGRNIHGAHIKIADHVHGALSNRSFFSPQQLQLPRTASDSHTHLQVKNFDAEKQEALVKWGETCDGYLADLERLCQPGGKFTSTGSTAGELVRVPPFFCRCGRVWCCRCWCWCWCWFWCW